MLLLRRQGTARARAEVDELTTPTHHARCWDWDWMASEPAPSGEGREGGEGGEREREREGFLHPLHNTSPIDWRATLPSPVLPVKGSFSSFPVPVPVPICLTGRFQSVPDSQFQSVPVSPSQYQFSTRQVPVSPKSVPVSPSPSPKRVELLSWIHGRRPLAHSRPPLSYAISPNFVRCAAQRRRPARAKSFFTSPGSYEREMLTAGAAFDGFFLRLVLHLLHLLHLQ